MLALPRPTASLQLAAAGTSRCAVPSGHLRHGQGLPESATFSASIGYDKEIFNTWPRRGVHLRRDRQSHPLHNRNDAVFGSPWSTGLDGTTNGVSTLTVVESSANHATTASPSASADWRSGFPVPANYTLAADKSDDDNERDPFLFRYARADRLDREYNYSDRDQRHRLNLWALYHFPFDIFANTRFSYYSAQPTSEKCVNNAPSGERATAPSDRICANGTILLRNTIRRENAFAGWTSLVEAVPHLGRGQFEVIAEVLTFSTATIPRSVLIIAVFNFDGTIRNGLGDPRQLQIGVVRLLLKPDTGHG